MHILVCVFEYCIFCFEICTQRLSLNWSSALPKAERTRSFDEIDRSKYTPAERIDEDMRFSSGAIDSDWSIDQQQHRQGLRADILITRPPARDKKTRSAIFVVRSLVNFVLTIGLSSWFWVFQTSQQKQCKTHLEMSLKLEMFPYSWEGAICGLWKVF